MTLEDGTEKWLFDYYPDEISLTASDFVGLTEKEARTLKLNRDRSFLDSNLRFRFPFVN